MDLSDFHSLITINSKVVLYHHFNSFQATDFFWYPPASIRKPVVFWCFQGVSKEISSMKWVKEKQTKYFKRWSWAWGAAAGQHMFRLKTVANGMDILHTILTHVLKIFDKKPRYTVIRPCENTYIVKLLTF